MTFYELAKKRFSCRNFSDKPVEPEKLKKILEAGSIAPSAHNKQPQKIYAITSNDGIEKISALSQYIYGARTVLIIAYDKNIAMMSDDRPGYCYGEMDATICATHMILQAAELGVDSCWVGGFSDTEVSHAFGLPENIQIVALMDLGYASEGVRPSHLHDKIRSLEETTAYL